ncbi:MAG TPA: indole-3-glycerol phosphate synthase TrpC [Ruminiclostridium sp.]|jgi:indole-3-glycerol phosphate synthase|nr:indole-3-glycerol phosphate synthase TrpC [Clostridiaceae bacterium]HAA24589.1 indole-3-glycerol phosphate synthase TrpC [Ruminiclostridium sp.]
MIPDILKKIVDARVERLKIEKKQRDVFDIINSCCNSNPPSFLNAIRKKGLSVIAELKRASPTTGLIRHQFEPIQTALQYEQAADAISVLTEQDYFLGSPAYLEKAAKAVSLPILRKDFIIDEYQVFEAKALGASCVLLIASILDREKLAAFIQISHGIGLDTLVEIHDENELEDAVVSGVRLIGINNRNLHTFSVDISTTARLSRLVPDDILVVSESGIRTEKDIQLLKNARIDGILVGECLMRSSCPAEKILELKRTYER